MKLYPLKLYGRILGICLTLFLQACGSQTPKPEADPLLKKQAIVYLDGTSQSVADSQKYDSRNINFTTDRLGKPNASFNFDGNSYIGVEDPTVINKINASKSFTLATWINLQTVKKRPGLFV